MARIKRDPDDWKAGGIKKRDFQHMHEEPEVPKHNPKKRKKKDTKRWCRGKEGREHVVVDTTLARRADFSCCNSKQQKHYSWNHRQEVKCQNCGMDSWRLPDEAKAQVNPYLKAMLEAEKKWCDEGHLYDWQSNMTSPPKAFEDSPNWYTNWEDNNTYRWTDRYWDRQICVMCGKRGKSRRRMQ